MDPNPTTSGPQAIKDFVAKVADGVLGFAALFAVGALVFSGIRYTTAYGDDQKIT